MERKATVFAVDDDSSVRRQLRRLIESVGHPCEVYDSAREFLDRYDPERAGCLVLDIRMPGLNGLDLQDELAKRNIDIPIIFLTGYGDIPMSVRAMKAGAVDFLPKPFNEQALLDAIHQALERDRDSRAARANRSEASERVARLTPREREVFEHVIRGELNKEIAFALGISEKTVKVHRGRVMEKMEADSVAELLVLAQAAGVYETPVGASAGRMPAPVAG